MTMQPRIRRSSPGTILLLATLLAALLGVCTPAAAEVRVTEQASGVLVVEAHDVTLRQVLEALGASHKIQFHDAPALAQNVTGTYSGTLLRILSRLLDRHDHVIRTTASGLRIEIIGAGPRVIAARAPVATPASATAATTGVVAPNVGNRDSSNVDLDEEGLAKVAGQGASTQVLSAAPWTRPGPPVLNENTGTTQHAPPQPVPQMVHGLVDLDGEITH